MAVRIWDVEGGDGEEYCANLVTRDRYIVLSLEELLSDVCES